MKSHTIAVTPIDTEADPQPHAAKRPPERDRLEPGLGVGDRRQRSFQR
jgi:hypothetical protein